MPTHFPNPAASPPAFYAPAPLFVHTTGNLQGQESAQVEKLIDDIVKKWADVEERATGLDINDIEYRAMAPTRVLRFKAKIKMRGRGRPLPYEIEDSEE